MRILLYYFVVVDEAGQQLDWVLVEIISLLISSSTYIHTCILFRIYILALYACVVCKQYV